MVQRRGRSLPQPLDTATVNSLAIAYVARYATTRGKLILYLKRKLRERGIADDVTIDPAAIAERLASSGYIDDENYARNHAGSLFAKGYGGRRIRAALGQAGIDREITETILPADMECAQNAADTYARRRRLGPYCPRPIDDATQRRHMAAMLRAGHDYSVAKAILTPKDD